MHSRAVDSLGVFSMNKVETISPVHSTPQTEVVPLAHSIENKIRPDHPGRMWLFPCHLTSSFATLQSTSIVALLPGGGVDDRGP